MSSSLPKSVLLLYFPVNKYLDIKNEHRLRTGEFTKHILFIRLTWSNMVKGNDIINRNYYDYWTYPYILFFQTQICVALKISVIYICNVIHIF